MHSFVRWLKIGVLTSVALLLAFCLTWWIGIPKYLEIDPEQGVSGQLELGMSEAEVVRRNGKPIDYEDDSGAIDPVYGGIYSIVEYGPHGTVERMRFQLPQTNFRHGVSMQLNLHYRSQVYRVDERMNNRQLKRMFGCDPAATNVSTAKWEALPPLTTDRPCYLAGYGSGFYKLLGTQTEIQSSEDHTSFVRVSKEPNELIPDGKSVVEWKRKYGADIR